MKISSKTLKVKEIFDLKNSSKVADVMQLADCHSMQDNGGNGLR